MPAPITAPTPSAGNETGPSVRFSVCSPVALASLSSQSIGFFLNSALLMRYVLRRVAAASESQTHHEWTRTKTNKDIDISNADQNGLRFARMKNNTAPRGSNY